jgi:hypothetical protein|eukprot:4382083-Prymnesium_polylepis.1
MRDRNVKSQKFVLEGGCTQWDACVGDARDGYEFISGAARTARRGGRSWPQSASDSRLYSLVALVGELGCELAVKLWSNIHPRGAERR